MAQSRNLLSNPGIEQVGVDRMRFNGENGSFGQRGGWWVAGQVPMLAAAAAVPAFTGSMTESRATMAAGLTLLAVGAWLAAWAAVSLGRSLTPFPKPVENGELCERGPYCFIRHPMYSAILILAAGWTLMRESIPGAAFLPLLALFFILKARSEERWLGERFPSYPDYRRRVKGFIPFVY
ncbi:MAG: methyltransferase family protein [Usitatibacter sp.]